jgi:hypothetical protein
MEKMLNPYHPVEPVHPMVVKLYDDLVAIYKVIRERYQKEIDAAFDRASQQIGFVVATTVPVILNAGERGTIKSISMGSESLKGTAFEREMMKALEPIRGGDPIPALKEGTYNIAVFWYDAVKLRLRTDWMEPAHPAYQLKSELMGFEPLRGAEGYVRCRPWMEPAHPVYQRATEKTEATRMFEHQEPAHWVDRANMIFQEKAVLISAIDEVYPELKLGERLSKARVMSPTLPLPPPMEMAWSGVREPAHMMAAKPEWVFGPSPQPWRAMGPLPDPWRQAMTEIVQVVSRYGPVPDPWRDQLISEIADVLGRYSYGMLNPQPLPPRAMAWSGVKEPAHMATVRPPWWGGDPAQRPIVSQEMQPQMLSEIASVLRRYGYQV